MALQGFNEDYYLNAKLEALQNDPATMTDWQGSSTADLATTLQQDYGLTPEQHYARYGYQEDLAPNAYFNAEEYVQAKSQEMVDNGGFGTVSEARGEFEARWQANPYEHYLQYGASEGINPSNDFDASAYYEQKLAELQGDPDTAGEWSGKSVDDVQQVFAESGLTPLGHFVAYGDEEGLTAPEVPAEEAVPGDEEPTGRILEVNGENLETSYDFASPALSEYSAIRFSGVTADTVNVDNLGDDNRLYATDSTLALNVAAASSVQLDLESSDVTLFGNEDAPALATLDVTVPAGQEADDSGSSLELGGSAAAALTNVTLAGAGDLNLTGATAGAQATEATTIDASAMTGSLTAGEGVLDEADSIQAGSGDDNLTVDGIHALMDGAAPTIDGGEGNDTLTVTGSEAIVSPSISGIETLQADSYITVDAAQMTDVENFVMGSGGELLNLAADQTVTATAGGLAEDYSPLLLRDAAETVNVVTDFSEQQQGQPLDLGVFTTEGEDELEGGTLNLSGNGGVAYTEEGRQFASVDASSLEAGLDFTGANYVQETVTLGESDAADTIGVTTTNSDNETTLTSSYGEEDMDSIVNFNIESDQIVADDGSAVVDFAADRVDVSEAADLTGAFETAATESAGADDYVAFQFQDNAYVYADSEAAQGSELSDGDFAIELTGVTLPTATTTPEAV